MASISWIPFERNISRYVSSYCSKQNFLSNVYFLCLLEKNVKKSESRFSHLNDYQFPNSIHSFRFEISPLIFETQFCHQCFLTMSGLSKFVLYKGVRNLQMDIFFTIEKKNRNLFLRCSNHQSDLILSSLGFE